MLVIHLIKECMRAFMGADYFRLLLVYLIWPFQPIRFDLQSLNTFITGYGFQLDGSELFHKSDELCFKVVKFKSIKFTSRTRIHRESSVWMKDGVLHLQTPDLDFPQDLTICVDGESNPGDTELT